MCKTGVQVQLISLSSMKQNRWSEDMKGRLTVRWDTIRLRPASVAANTMKTRPKVRMVSIVHAPAAAGAFTSEDPPETDWWV